MLYPTPIQILALQQAKRLQQAMPRPLPGHVLAAAEKLHQLAHDLPCPLPDPPFSEVVSPR